MVRKCPLLTSMLVAAITSFGQGISRQDADSILAELNKHKPTAQRAELLLTLAQYHIFKPGENEIDFDSARVYIKEADLITSVNKQTAVYGFQLLTESYLEKEKGKKAAGRRLAEQAVKILESDTYGSYLGRAYYELSMYFNFRDSAELITRAALTRKSIDAFQRSGDLLAKARALEMLGDIHRLRYIDEKIRILREALATYESIKYPHLQGVYVLLGESYEFAGQYGMAYSHLLTALKIAQGSDPNSMQLCQIKNSLANLLHKIYRCDLEVKYRIEGLEIAKINGDQVAIGDLSTSLALAYNELHQPEKTLNILKSLPTSLPPLDIALWQFLLAKLYLSAYTDLKEFGKASVYAEEVLKLIPEIPETAIEERVYAYRALAKFSYLTGDYSKSRKYLQKTATAAKKIKYVFERSSDGLELLYKLDSAEGDFYSAFEHLREYKARMDSVNGETQARRFQVMAIEYEVSMKEDSIKLKDKDITLLKQTNKLQQASLRQASLVRNFTVAGIGVASVMIGLLFYQFRNKQMHNHLITQKNEVLQHYLHEKEWLLKEIHHRVKNNLQMVMSLLNSQSAYVNNQSALNAIHDSQHRIHAMSLIHQKLYNTENLATIDISTYIRELVSYLVDSFDTGRRILFELEIEHIEMDVSQAIPLGLILNEAITNAIKYAFPGNRAGKVLIALSSTTPGHYLMVISDDGIGLPADFTGSRHGSLGMRLMAGLSEDLDGQFSIQADGGTTIKVTFVHHLMILRGQNSNDIL